MASPVLRATGEDGSTYDDPSENLLFDLVGEIDDGELEFLIVEKTADPTGLTYVQTTRNKQGDWFVERQEGSVDRHYETVAQDRYDAHRMLVGWAFEVPDWDRGLQWTHHDPSSWEGPPSPQDGLLGRIRGLLGRRSREPDSRA
ncbi:hypothetical protein AB0P21_19340 [Kribbella sp. NPDC056861]|uniref:hypothetical protein n=1 Tax=Kribbella sp. NPDC056861 TaxID=3154857 RepID=UPI0034162E23